MDKLHLRARDALREWRGNQTPRMSLEKLGGAIGKTGALVGMFENSRATLVLGDCVALHRITGIPLRDFLPPEKADEILDSASLMEPAA